MLGRESYEPHQPSRLHLTAKCKHRCVVFGLLLCHSLVVGLSTLFTLKTQLHQQLWACSDCTQTHHPESQTPPLSHTPQPSRQWPYIRRACGRPRKPSLVASTSLHSYSRQSAGRVRRHTAQVPSKRADERRASSFITKEKATRDSHHDRCIVGRSGRQQELCEQHKHQISGQ